MADDLFLDHLAGQRLLEKRVIKKIELAGGQIVCRAEILIHLFEQRIRYRTFFLTGEDLLFIHIWISFRFMLRIIGGRRMGRLPGADPHLCRHFYSTH